MTGRLIVLATALAIATASTPGQAQPSPSAPPSAATSEKLFIALYRRGPAYRPGVPIFQQPSVDKHIKHHEDLGDRLIAAGPTAPGSDDLVGAIVISAPDKATAERWLAADPAIVAGVLKGDIRQWGSSEVRAFSARR